MTAAEPSVVAETNRVVHLEDAGTKRRERGEIATEGIAAYTLLNAAFVSYRTGALNAFLIVNVVAGVSLAIVVVRGTLNLWRNRDAALTSINIVGVFGGVATIAEGINKLHSADFTFGHKHFALGVVTIILGLATTTLALMAERLEHLRALTISDQGIRMRLKFRRFSVGWTDVAEMRVTAQEARIIDARGKACVVPLPKLVNRNEVTEALTRAFAARGIPFRTVKD